MRWIVASIPPVRPSRGWHGLAIFGAGSSSAPLAELDADERGAAQEQRHQDPRSGFHVNLRR